MTDGGQAWRRRGLVAAPPQLRARLRESGWWGDHCLLDWWRLAVRACPDRRAVIDRSGTSFTYAEADELSSRFATWLAGRGIGRGDIVGVELPNWSEFLPVLIGVTKVGATIAPLSPNLRRSEVLYATRLCESRVLVLPAVYRRTDFRGLPEELRAAGSPAETFLFVSAGDAARPEDPRLADLLADVEPMPAQRWTPSSGDDVAAVLFTSGSEAQPKGVMLTHNNLIASEASFAYALRVGPDDAMFMPAPLGHATGFMHGVVMPILARAASVLCDSTEGRDMAPLIGRYRVTCGMSVPAVIDALLCMCRGSGEGLETVRFLCCGGSPVPRRLLQQAHELGIRLYSVYGATESAPHTMTTFLDSDERVLHTDGCACPGTEIRIVDPATRRVLPPGVQGEEASRGPAVFSGYLGRPDLTAKVLDGDGWYYSGDLGILDEDGYVRITGRIKDLIIRGGENISPAEVENVLLGHPDIAAAAVIGVPDDVLGQRALAFLVARGDRPHLDVAGLREWFADCGIAKFKIPEYVEYLPEMPLTSSGKIDKVALRRMVQELREEKAALERRASGARPRA